MASHRGRTDRHYKNICRTTLRKLQKLREIHLKRNQIQAVILNSVRQHNHFITQGNYKATCFHYRLDILRPILSIVSQDAMHTSGSHRVYIYGIHQIKSFVSKGVSCKLCLQQWDT